MTLYNMSTNITSFIGMMTTVDAYVPFGELIAFLVFIVGFISFYSTSQSFGTIRCLVASSFITSIISVFLFALSVLNEAVLQFFIVLSAGSLILLYVTK